MKAPNMTNNGRPMTDDEKRDALERAIAARDRGIAPEKPKTRRRRERAKVLSVTVRDGKPRS
jgi:hypothetical protein